MLTHVKGSVFRLCEGRFFFGSLDGQPSSLAVLSFFTEDREGRKETTLSVNV